MKKRVRGGIFHSINRYATTASNKYMKEYDKNFILKSYIIFATFDANWHDKSEYVIYIRNLKQALNHRLVLKRYIEWLNFIEKFGQNYVLMWKPN